MKTMETNVTNQPGPMSTALRYGIICALLSIAYGLIFYLLNMSLNRGVMWFGYIILVVCIVLGVRAHRDRELGGYMSFGRGLGAGSLISLIAGVMLAAYAIPFFTVIAPEVHEELIRKTEAEMMEKAMSPEAYEQSLKYAKMMLTPAMMAVWSLVWIFFIGFVTSLITAAIMQKKQTIA